MELNIKVCHKAQGATLLTTIQTGSKVAEDEVSSWSWSCTYDYSLLDLGCARPPTRRYHICFLYLPLRFECSQELIF